MLVPEDLWSRYNGGSNCGDQQCVMIAYDTGESHDVQCDVAVPYICQLFNP